MARCCTSHLQASFTIWQGGGRRVVGEALVNGTLPSGLEGQYNADQFRLLCLAQVHVFHFLSGATGSGNSKRGLSSFAPALASGNT